MEIVSIEPFESGDNQGGWLLVKTECGHIVKLQFVEGESGEMSANAEFNEERTSQEQVQEIVDAVSKIIIEMIEKRFEENGEEAS